MNITRFFLYTRDPEKQAGEKNISYLFFGGGENTYKKKLNHKLFVRSILKGGRYPTLYAKLPGYILPAGRAFFFFSSCITLSEHIAISFFP